MTARQIFVVATARSGSNQLVQYLNQLQGCLCVGEVIKDRFSRENGWDKIASRFPDPATALDLHTNNVTEFWHQLAATYDSEADWVGAKIFYAHRKGDPIWDLVFDPSTAVIHLWRPRIMDTFLSLLVAEATGEWTARRNAPETDKAMPLVEFPRKRYLQYRDTVQSAFQSVRARLADHPKLLNVEYPEIGEPAPLAARLRDFLDTTGDLKQTLRKQAKQPPETFVANADVMLPFMDDRLDQPFTS